MAPNSKNPSEKVDGAKEDLRGHQGSNFYEERQIKDVDPSNLNQGQRFAANIIQQNINSQTLMIIMGGPGTGKITVVKAVTEIVNETVQNIPSVIRLGTTGTAEFVVYDSTFHSVLSLPINIPFSYLKEFNLK